ncbi:hypothetical protein ACTFIW_003254 [Dictyostelium discoideum]
MSHLMFQEKTLSEESLKEFNYLKKEFEGENIFAIPIEQDNTKPIDTEKVKASTDMPIHSDNNNLNNGSFHLYCEVSDKALSGVLYQIQEFDYKLRHISGKTNGIADFLSRKYDNFQSDESFLNKI